MKKIRHTVATWLHALAKLVDTPEARAAFEKATQDAAKAAADAALKAAGGA